MRAKKQGKDEECDSPEDADGGRPDSPNAARAGQDDRERLGPNISEQLD
jgi:hypothetical protein